MKGIRSGDKLISPEITYKIWKKYPDKELIGNIGEHVFNKGRDVIHSGKMKTISDGPVYRLTKPSYNIPTKHENIFHPDVINSNGTIRVPFWKNPDIYKITVPFVLGGSYVYNSTNNGSNFE